MSWGRARSGGYVRAAPPLIEPELTPASRLIDPQVDGLVRQMSERLARVAAFALEAEEVYGELPDRLRWGRRPAGDRAVVEDPGAINSVAA